MFHFNKGHLTDPTLPMWIIMAKGKTYYVEHVEASVPWTTKETPDNVRTKGALKFKDCLITIDDDNCAHISTLTKSDIIRIRNKEQGITRIISGWVDLLKKTLTDTNIKHGPIKRFSRGCGSVFYICDIIKPEDVTVIGFLMPEKYRILMPNEVYYKWYDDPAIIDEDFYDYDD